MGLLYGIQYARSRVPNEKDRAQLDENGELEDTLAATGLREMLDGDLRREVGRELVLIC
tara:strand:+ start:61 stop:237 length:177 start_codon:yes stop_codon:yes gene_type:complete